MVRRNTKITEDNARQSEQSVFDITGEYEQEAGELGTISLESVGTDPDTGTQADPGSEAPRKRKPRSDAGIKRGSRGATSKGTKANISLEAVERLLYSSHMILGTILKTQEIALTEEEAKQLGIAIGSVARHYETEVAAKTLDWINLVQCGAFIYGSRVVAWKARKTMEKAERKAAKSNGSAVKEQPDAMPTTLYDVVIQ